MAGARLLRGGAAFARLFTRATRGRVTSSRIGLIRGGSPRQLCRAANGRATGQGADFARDLATFLDAYNFAKRLKSLRALTPFERICQFWTERPERFRLNPLHHTLGLNI